MVPRLFRGDSETGLLHSNPILEAFGNVGLLFKQGCSVSLLTRISSHEQGTSIQQLCLQNLQSYPSYFADVDTDERTASKFDVVFISNSESTGSNHTAVSNSPSSLAQLIMSVSLQVDRRLRCGLKRKIISCRAVHACVCAVGNPSRFVMKVVSYPRRAPQGSLGNLYFH